MDSAMATNDKITFPTMIVSILGCSLITNHTQKGPKTVSSKKNKLTSAAVIYLGANVPLENLYLIAKQVEPTHYLTFSVRSNVHDSINKYLASMNKEFKNPPIHICCSNDTSENLKLSSNQNIIASFQEFLNLIGA